MILRKEKTAKSAVTDLDTEPFQSRTWFPFRLMSSSLNFHTIRKASPIFLFADPPYLLTYEWTMSAIWLTNIINLTSIASATSEKWWISQNPNIAMIFCPESIGFKSPPDLMFEAIIFAPASPYPKASRNPIREIVSSSLLVSSWSFYLTFLLFLLSKFIKPAFSKSPFAAARGSLAITLTFSIILSIGLRTNFSASLVKNKAPIVSKMHIMIVRAMLM